MDKNENIIPQIIMILNINYNNTFYKLRFKFKNSILLLEVYDIRFFILILNKIFIYFVNSITCKSKKYLCNTILLFTLFLFLFLF